MDNKQVVYSGPGFFTLLGLLFIGLKLGGVIDWSWVWVLAPIWGQVALGLAIALVILLAAGVFLLVAWACDW